MIPPRMLASLLILLAPPATAVPDIWYIDKRQQESATFAEALQEKVGKPISRAEALQIARRALERAERRRLEVAEYEAARGIQWEDES